MKTPISYYGGKQAMINHILPLIPLHDNYTEAFFGGGTVFFAKHKAKNETINDKLDIVINFYQVLKTRFDELKPLIDASLMSRSEHKRALHILRDPQSDPVVKAWAFWYSSNFSFANKIGGGMKYSNDRSCGQAQSMHRKKEKFTKALASRIEDASIECNDAIKVITSRDHINTFHYIDPPYPSADQGHYKGYTHEEFDELLSVLPTLSGKFLLSNYWTDSLRKMVDDNGYHYKEIIRKISAAKDTDKTKTEVLIWNYELETNLFNQDTPNNK